MKPSLSLVLVLLLTACAAPVATPTQAPTEVPTLASNPTEVLSPTPSPYTETLPNSLQLVEAPPVHAFPGPLHYAGDKLTLEIPFSSFVESTEATATLTIDGVSRQVSGQWQFNYLLLPEAIDTTRMEGGHMLHVQAEYGEVVIDFEVLLDVLPADQRPAQEADLQWLTESIACCDLHYLTNTAAARDIAHIAEIAQQSADEIAEATGVDLNGAIQIFLFDRMWGNGAFGGNGELAVVYFDRGYGPAQGDLGLQTLFRHELTHATGIDFSEELGSFFRYNEGLAVYLAGGHYKPEPLQQRAAAMVEMSFDGSLSGGDFITSHEIAYLHAASVVNFVIDEYGWDTFLQFRDAAVFDNFFDESQMEPVIQQVFGVSLADFQEAYLAWLTAVDAGEQTVDLQLTIDLQALRRDYQRRFAPQPEFVFGAAESSYGLPSAMPSLVREANAPANQALELMIADGQRAMTAGDYALAQLLVDAVRDAIETGAFTTPLGSYYASAVEALAANGYEVMQLTFADGAATAVVTTNAPQLSEVQLELMGEVWAIVE